MKLVKVFLNTQQIHYMTVSRPVLILVDVAQTAMIQKFKHTCV